MGLHIVNDVNKMMVLFLSYRPLDGIYNTQFTKVSIVFIHKM